MSEPMQCEETAPSSSGSSPDVSKPTGSPSPGTLVWVKTQGFPWWPAKCISVSPAGLKVSYFNESAEAVVTADKVLPFDDQPGLADKVLAGTGKPTMKKRLSAAVAAAKAPGAKAAAEAEAAAAAEAEAEAAALAEQWRSDGHDHLRKRVARQFGKRLAFGTITAWAPPDGEDGALFHVQHDDGDEEDLDEEEAAAALQTYAGSADKDKARKKEAAAGGKKKRPAAAGGAAEPQKPKTAYARYIEDARARIKGESPSASPSDVHSLALAAWKAAGKEEKAPYDAAFAADKARYEKECAEAGIEPAKRGRKSGDGDAAPPQQPPVSNGPAAQAAFALDQAKRTGAEAAKKRRGSGAGLLGAAPSGRRPEPDGVLSLEGGAGGPDPGRVWDRRATKCSGGAAGRAVGLWAAAQSLTKEIALSRFSLDQLCAALSSPASQHPPAEAEAPLLGELHVRLLRTALATPPAAPTSLEELLALEAGRANPATGAADRMPPPGTWLRPPLDAQLLHQPPPPALVTAGNWPALLANVGPMLPAVAQVAGDALSELRRGGYATLSLDHRLDLLEGLLDAALEEASVRAALNANYERREERARERRARRRANGEVGGEAGGEEGDDKSAAKPDKGDKGDKGDKPKAFKAFKAPLPEGAGVAAEQRRAKATAALLAALSTREEGKLAAAISLAEASLHTGVLEPAEEGSGPAKPWATDELLAARSALEAERRSAARVREAAGDHAAEQAEAEASLQDQDALPCRISPLGSDGKGRTYWLFGADVSRLWVQGAEADGWGWAFYSKPKQLGRLVASLDGSAPGSAEAGLKAALLRLTPLLQRSMATEEEEEAAAGGANGGGGVGEEEEEEEDWLLVGHALVGRRVSRSFDRAAAEAAARAEAKEAARASEVAAKALHVAERAAARPKRAAAEAAAAAVVAAAADTAKARDGGGGTMLGRITRWLPPDGEDGALFHVRHDDGDEEDLDEEEAAAAVAAYDDTPARELAEICARLEAKPQIARERRYENKAVRSKAARAVAASLRAETLRAEIVDFEAEVWPALQRPDCSWEEGRRKWLRRLQSAQLPADQAQLLLDLEAAVHTLQAAPDLVERKPWLKTGHEAIKQRARRFFREGGEEEEGEGEGEGEAPPLVYRRGGGWGDGSPGAGGAGGAAAPSYFHSDGWITGWMPAAGGDEALWHMEHDDGDEEDLDEEELRHALENLEAGREQPTLEEEEYFARVAAAAKAAEGDGEEKEAEGQSAWGAVGGDRLWRSGEGRQRWREALEAPQSRAHVSLALVALRAHCRRFLKVGDGVTRDQRERTVQPNRAEELAEGVRPWYHPEAFPLPKGQKAKGSAATKAKK